MPTATQLNNDSIWQAILSAIETRVDNDNSNTWFRPLKIIAIDETSLTLKAPDRVFEDWIMANYYNELLESLEEAGLANLSITFEIAAKPVPPAPVEKVSTRRKRFSSNSQTITQETFEIPVAEAVEKGILGALISFEEGIVRASEAGLTRDHFVLSHHKILFSAMLSIHLNGGNINAIGLIDYLRTQHKLDEIGGPDAIGTLVEGAAGLTSISSLIEQLNVVRYKRKALENAVKLQRMASNGASTTDIEELLDSFERSNTQAQAYAATPGGMILRKASKYGFGTEADKLANFNATITSEQIEDDGSEDNQRVFELQCDLNGDRSLIRVPASKFSAMGWPTAQLGARAIVYPGKESQARTAIQTLSRNIRTMTVYTHTGWRQIDGVWSYLHGGGAIAPTGNRTDVSIRLPSSLRAFHLPDPPIDPQIPEADKVFEAYDTVFTFMNAFPKWATIPLLGGVFAAVLGSLNYSIYVLGESGSFKSELTMLGQSFFGAGFNSSNFPANWTNDSVNNLLAKMFTAKDAWLVIDDFVTIGQKMYDDKQHAKAEQILRAAANRSGRGRAGTKGTVAEGAAKDPRGLIVSSGETLPNGGSLQNRTLIITLKKGDIKKQNLSAMQRMRGEGKFAASLSAFIHFIASDYQKIVADFKARCEQLRDDLLAKTDDSKQQHARQPTTLTHLAASWEVWLKAAEAKRIITTEQKQELWKEIWKTLVEQIDAQKEQQSTQNPADYFLTLLRSALLSGKAHLATVEGEQPETPVRYGWRHKQPLGQCVGWVDGPYIYLQGENAYQIAAAQGISLGEGIPINQKILFERMDDRGMLVKKDPGHGRQARVPVIRAKAYVIAKTSLFDDET